MQNEMTAEKKKNEGGTGHLVKIVVVLTAICVCVALLLAFVNNITKDVIAETAAKKQSDAILSMFGGFGSDAKEVREYTTDDGTTVYAVIDDGVLIGYAVPSSGTGFGGERKTTVGFSLAGKVIGVKIISMSETPGVGSKTQNEDFLARYVGKSETLTVGENFDGIANATISSKGVTEAVNKAINLPLDVTDMAVKLGAAITVDYVKSAGGDN